MAAVEAGAVVDGTEGATVVGVDEPLSVLAAAGAVAPPSPDGTDAVVDPAASVVAGAALGLLDAWTLSR